MEAFLCYDRQTGGEWLEYHHNQKKDAPNGTALMIREALVQATLAVTVESIDICSVRGGNIFGEHEVIFSNCKDEVTTYRHQVSSHETFSEGAIEVAIWTCGQESGLYGMDEFCEVHS